jgi:HemY protein
MKRLLLFVLTVAVLVAAAVWLADRPGEVTIHWQGWRIDTTVPVLAVALLLLLAAMDVLLRVGRFVVGGPSRLLAARRSRRVRDGYRALSDGLAAVASGDRDRSRKLATKADRLLADRSLTGLLTAQAAELAGDQDEARRRFQDMVGRPETAFLGLKGLLELALKDKDHEAALDYARRAWALNAGGDGLAATLFELQAGAGQWSEAELTLDEARRRKAMTLPELGRRRALVLDARAAAAEAANASDALALAVKAHEADPAFVPATVRAARLLSAAGKDRKARAVVEAAFRIAPHPALTAAWSALVPDEAPLEWVKRLDRLVKTNPLAPEGHIALAEAALAARLWGQARHHLETALAKRPSQGCYRLLARIERDEKKDEAAAQAWLAKAADAPVDPAWRCGQCNGVAAEFTPACPHCGAVDGLAWR